MVEQKNLHLWPQMEHPIEYLVRNNLQHTNVLVLEITLLLLLTDHLS